MCSLHLVLQLGGDLDEADLGGGSGGKAAIWIQGDAGGVKVLESGLDAGDNFTGRINLAGITAHTPKANLKVFT